MEIRPKKSLGQHFLNSKHVLEQIITAAKVRSGEIVLEIGPGTGVLTQELLKAGAKVLAIEKDDRAISLLKDKFSEEISRDQLQIVHGDILDPTILTSHLSSLISHLSSIASHYSVVANIPYYITGAILERFLEHEPRPNRMILLLQKEVSDRIIARDGKESLLSISVKAFGTPRMIAKVPRGAFTPPPNVDSAILEISDISGEQFNAKNVEIRRFFEILKAGFAHKRKFLIRNLETAANRERLKSTWTDLGLNEKVRAEDMSIEKWFSIVKKIS